MPGTDIYLTFESAPCDQFQEAPTGKKSILTKVMAPLRVEGTGTEKLKLISGCNMFQGCFNPICWYSMEGRKKPKFKVKE